MLKPWLRLVRLPLAPTAVCDSLACGALAHASAAVGTTSSIPSAMHWVGLGATSFLLYAFGMAGNDLADRKVDRRKNPGRPLPSGALKPHAVIVVLVLAAAGALALAEVGIGDRYAVLAALACASLYNFALKRRVVPGAVSMGLVRASNASLAVWPLLLAGEVSWVLLLAPLCVGLYSCAVTLLSTTEDEDAPGRVLACRLLTAVAFGGGAAAAWIVGGLPTLGAGIAFGVASSTLVGRTPRPGPPKRQVLEMLLGLYWLAYVIATGAHGGSYAWWVVLSLAGLPVAWALAIGSQLLIRWLQPR